jgi:hypothetical protein
VGSSVGVFLGSLFRSVSLGFLLVCWRGLAQRGLYLGWCHFGSFSRTVEGIGCRFWIFITLFGSFFLVRRWESDADFGPLSRELVFSGGLDCAGLILDLLLVRWRGSDAGFGSSPSFLDLFLVRRRESDADFGSFFCELV